MLCDQESYIFDTPRAHRLKEKISIHFLANPV